MVQKTPADWKALDANIMQSLEDVEDALDEVKLRARQRGVRPEMMWSEDGHPTVTPLLHTKALLIHAHVLINRPEAQG